MTIQTRDPPARDPDGATLWACRQLGRVTGQELALLIHLARNADDGAMIHVSLASLCADLHFSMPTASRVLLRLADRGLIERLRDRAARLAVLGPGCDDGAGLYRVCFHSAEQGPARR